MYTHQILTSDYLDILFDGRNKLYGSYVLRRAYTLRLCRAAFTGISIVTLAICTPIFLHSMKEKLPDTIILHDVPGTIITPITEAEKKILPPKQVTPPAATKPTIKLTPPVIEKDETVSDDMRPPAQENIGDKVISTTTQIGIDDGIDPGMATGSGSGIVDAPPPADVVLEYVDQMPEFIAGDLLRYLSDHIRYPEAARENGIQGRVLLRFVVNEDGSVSDVNAFRRIGGGCDEEAIRVVKAMPKWKPGKLNGRSVKVYFTLPVFFRLE